jgi:cobalt-zinc-cadmium efflux system membrane fusion protein
MFVPRAVGGVSRMGATLPSILFVLLALPATLSIATGSADSSASSPVSEQHEHPAHDPETGENRHADSSNHDGHEPASGGPAPAPDHDENTSDHRHDGETAHGQGSHPQEPGEDHDGHGHEGTSEIHLSPEQRQTLDLEISVLEPRTLGKSLRVPGEVRSNAYATAQVTPRIDAQVLARHARLGDQVEKGQPLVTLSSVDMAEAQGDLVVAEREWQRLKKLNDQFVSDTEYLAASVARQKALSNVLAYGMTQAQAEALVTASEKADGTFELLAPASGTVVRDDFVLGELVKPGHVLFEITDESVRWVEARMPPEEAAQISVGAWARIAYRGAWFDGRVTQIHHHLDEITRTQAVRVEVPDPEHRLHPGVFVDVVVLAGEGEPVLALPEAAVLRSPDGHWQLFAAEGGDAFKPVKVKLVRTAGGMAVIEGIPAGTRVVTRGAFFLQSELAKGGFDPHNH